MSTLLRIYTLLTMLSLHLQRQKRAYMAGALVLATLVVLIVFIAPSGRFNAPQYLIVNEGATTSGIAEDLYIEGLIESPLLFKALARVTGSDDALRAGRYYFEKPTGMAVLLYRITHGITGITERRVTIPEGYTSYQIASRMQEVFPAFDADTFATLAVLEEGYLFPDTYSFPSDVTPEEVVERMTDQFAIEVEELEEDIDMYGKSLEDVVIMASLLEREGRNLDERRIIANILWKREAAGRALQVDAVFGYIQKRETYHPSLEDLEIDSLYNTYKYPGLPPGPIANPGLESLHAAVTPTQTTYWYYLTGKDGEMYYATSFEEHKRNRELYL